MNILTTSLKGKKILVLLLSFAAFIPLVSSEEKSEEDSSVVLTNDKPVLIQVLRFRVALVDAMIASDRKEISRNLLEKYHEEVAIPAFRKVCELATQDEDENLLREAYLFVSACGDSADEEVTAIGASVFKEKSTQSRGIIISFDPRASMSLLDKIEFGIKNLQIKAEQKSKPLAEIDLLRREIRERKSPAK